MDIKAGKPYPSTALSNFAPHPFVFRGVECNSMEGLLQGFKFENPEMQKYVCTLVGRKAKFKGKNKTWWKTQTLYWQGTPIKRDSDQYQQLLDEAYQCLFDQNQSARKALLASGDAVLTHSIGKNKINQTVLTEKEFCSRLMQNRARLKLQEHFDETNDN